MVNKRGLNRLKSGLSLNIWCSRGSASTEIVFKPLNAELNPICHLLVLLGDLTFMGPYIVSLFQYISNKMHGYAFYLYL
jgi:hypothetical protein